MTTRTALMRAAADAIEATGYDAASVASIIDRADVTKGALYHHFPSKAALARALVDDQFAPVLTRPTVDGEPLLHIAEVTLNAVQALVGEPEFRAAFGLVVDRPRPEVGDITWPLSEWRRVLAELFASAGEQGDLVADADPAVEAALVVTFVVGQFSISRSIGNYDDILPTLLQFWITTINRVAVAEKRGQSVVAWQQLVNDVDLTKRSQNSAEPMG
ncbi:putative TetR family transcriptional regulator [Gordonia effusa NBRC 100432]|uniref:Putative TetR family transcriptional regulator n=1 Tax=Gordonia effusa NBRC 100432 TaxID=1077974 RepID=H0R1C7_9ACTN|nr:TetR/AcrR family transcriptional regulator [Gordonia effusa]GAB18878.1 putative TetR family transcriptional regulator [Gordonia effusa NBRC 100432]